MFVARIVHSSNVPTQKTHTWSQDSCHPEPLESQSIHHLLLLIQGRVTGAEV